MQIIPVIDLKNNHVVLAKRGERDNYQPIHSPLCADSNIEAVIAAFLKVYPFRTFYIADLNAITKQGHHDALITKIVRQFPKINFWVDKGYQETGDYLPNYYPVLGSECYQDDNILQLKNFQQRFILSLDYNALGKLGALQLFEQTALWPRNIIIMSLQRVGSFQGADMVTLKQFKQTYPAKNFIAAGGIRHADDLNQLAALGIHTALIASALHSGALTCEIITQLESKENNLWF